MTDRSATIGPLEYLQLVYPNSPGWLVISHHIPGQEGLISTSIEATNLELVAKTLTRITQQHEVWMGVCPQSERPAGNARGGASTTLSIPGLWLDVDFGAAGHADKALPYPPDDESAIKAIRRFKLPPTLIIHSGGGLYPWWLFHTQWIFESQDDRERAKDLSRRFHQTMIDEWQGLGWKLDNTGDLARILRVPGTVNRKLPVTRPVRVIEMVGSRYDPADFEPLIVKVQAKPTVKVQTKVVVLRPTSDEPSEDLTEAIVRYNADHEADATEWPKSPIDSFLCPVCQDHRSFHQLPDNPQKWVCFSSDHQGVGIKKDTCWIGDVLDIHTHASNRTRAQLLKDTGYLAKFPRAVDPSVEFSIVGEIEEDPEIPLAAFPIKIFPPPLRDYVSATAESVVCPVDFPGITLMVAAGVAIGASHELEVKPGWTAGGRLFAAIVGNPADAKTPAMNAVLAPIFRRQIRLDEINRAAEEFYEASLQDRRGKKDHSPPPQRPRRGKIVTTDATIEAIASMLEHNPRGILYHADELSGWVRGMNAYRAAGKGADRENWLKIWQGQSIHLDRKTSGSISVARPFASVLGCIPPDILPTLSTPDHAEDGFTHRLIMSYPSPIKRRWTESTVSPALSRWWDEAISGLVELPFSGSPTVLRFTPEARPIFVDLISEHYAEMNGDLPGMLRGVWGKADNHAARFTLILQLLWGITGEGRMDAIERPAVIGGWALADYVKSHARKSYPAIRADKVDRQIAQIIEWLSERGGEGKLRDLYRSKVGGIKTSSSAKKLAQEMADRGLCQIGTVDLKGQKCPTVRLVNSAGCRQGVANG